MTHCMSESNVTGGFTITSEMYAYIQFLHGGKEPKVDILGEESYRTKFSNPICYVSNVWCIMKITAHMQVVNMQILDYT